MYVYIFVYMNNNTSKKCWAVVSQLGTKSCADILKGEEIVL